MNSHSETETRIRPSIELLLEPRNRPTVSVEEAAVILGVSRGSAYAAIRSGTIPSLRIGRRVLVPTARLAALLGVSEPASLPLDASGPG